MYSISVLRSFTVAFSDDILFYACFLYHRFALGGPDSQWSGPCLPKYSPVDQALLWLFFVMELHYGLRGDLSYWFKLTQCFNVLKHIP
jgi:hypothetical protein